MLQVQGCHGLENLSKVGEVLNIQQQKNSLMHTGKDDAGISISRSGQKTLQEKKSKEAANKHALAERNRRKRINHHLNTLRKLFPNLPKSDKPRVLTETVRYLKELREKMADHVVVENSEEGCCIGGKENRSLFLPGEKDEVNVSYCEGGEGRIMVEATICCEDRQSLNGDLMEAVRSTKGRVVKAEMATIGGRTKAVLVVQWCKEVVNGGGGGGGGGEGELGSLRRALKAVVENRALRFASLLGPKLKNERSASLGLERGRACGSIGDGPSFRDGLFTNTE